MAAEVPAADALNAVPAAALSRVPGLEDGRAPRLLRRLLGGSVNEVFRVDSERGRFVLRLDGAQWRRRGVERQREFILHRAAAAGGFAPAIVHADASAGILVTEYVAGETWSAARFEQAAELARLGMRLRALHELMCPQWAPFDPLGIAASYVGSIPARHAPEELERVLQQLHRTWEGLPRTRPLSIVHGDLAHGNLLQGQRLWLLDWEYAQVADPLMDLACVLAYYPLAAAHAESLLAAAGFELQVVAEELNARVYIYRALTWLWHCARGERAPLP
jgi:thiamine kinase-like enzyme